MEEICKSFFTVNTSYLEIAKYTISLVYTFSITPFSIYLYPPPSAYSIPKTLGISQETALGLSPSIRVEESADFGVIIPALEVIQPGFLDRYLATVLFLERIVGSFRGRGCDLRSAIVSSEDAERSSILEQSPVFLSLNQAI